MDEPEYVEMASIYDTEWSTACDRGCRLEMCVFALVHQILMCDLTCGINVASVTERDTIVCPHDFDSRRDSKSPSGWGARQPEPSNSSSHPPEGPKYDSVDAIHRLMQHPALYDPLRKPRYPIVLCHGTVTLPSIEAEHLNA